MNTIKDLQGLSEKIYLCLNKPEEEENVSDHLRLSRALEELYRACACHARYLP